MNKITWALVPAGVTFGPLFMTRIGGTASGEATHLVWLGTAMLALSLCVMFTLIMKQQSEIAQLKRKSN